jgi:ribosome-associated heat shock protein Hsp15
LWHARVVKTRSLAQGLVEAGHVRLNRARVTKPGHDVAVGDVLTIALNSRVLVMKVTGFAERRGAYPQARLLYEDLSQPHDAPAQKEGASEAGNC